jgi:hypothetical protein
MKSEPAESPSWPTSTSNYTSTPSFNFENRLKIDPCQWRQSFGPDVAKEMEDILTPNSHKLVQDPREAYMCGKFALFVWRLPGAATMVASTGISNAQNYGEAPLALLPIAVSRVWRFYQYQLSCSWQHSQQILPAQHANSPEDYQCLFSTLYELLMENISGYQPCLFGARHCSDEILGDILQLRKYYLEVTVSLLGRIARIEHTEGYDIKPAAEGGNNTSFYTFSNAYYSPRMLTLEFTGPSGTKLLKSISPLELSNINQQGISFFVQDLRGWERLDGFVASTFSVATVDSKEVLN